MDRVNLSIIPCFLSSDVGYYKLTSLFAALGVRTPGAVAFYMSLLLAGVLASFLWLLPQCQKYVLAEAAIGDEIRFAAVFSGLRSLFVQIGP